MDRPDGQAPAKALRVLVVEDEPSVRLLCTLNLTAAGFEVAEAATGAEALARVAERSFDLVLLDVMLPDIGGHDLGRRLHGVPIAYVSARADRDDLIAAYELGAVDYITKPFDPTVLPERVREIVGRVERGESEHFRLERLAELRR